MKNIFKSALMLMAGIALLTACEDDRDDNPTVYAPTEFVLNTPAAASENIDLASSSALTLTCSQPNYGFPASTKYTVQVSLNEDMSDMVALDQNFQNTVINVDPSLLASTLTTLALNSGKAEEDFPLDIPVYVRLRACIVTDTDGEVAGTEILSNVIKLSSVHVKYSLAPVDLPKHIYVVGSFCGWDWGSCFEFVPVYEHPEMFWRMVYIDDQGVKINTEKAWDGGEKGFSQITVDGDLKGEIVDGGGNIASSKPGWYLMIVTASVKGRDIVYNVQFNQPLVWLMGNVIGSWDECADGWSFDVPATKDGDFVSPAFAGSSAGDADGGVRAYVKVPGNDWWHSEFMVLNGVIEYRGAGGDQARVSGNAGQRLYLNFSNGTGAIK